MASPWKRRKKLIWFEGEIAYLLNTATIKSTVSRRFSSGIINM
jgi:hypothetical protein